MHFFELLASEIGLKLSISGIESDLTLALRFCSTEETEMLLLSRLLDSESDVILSCMSPSQTAKYCSLTCFCQRASSVKLKYAL